MQRLILTVILCSTSWLLAQNATVTNSQSGTLTKTVDSNPSISIRRDDQAIAILTDYIRVSTPSLSASTIKDFEQTGGVIQYWSSQRQITGTARVVGRGTSQLMLEFNTNSGKSQWYMNGNEGKHQSIDGTVAPIPFHNRLTLGALTFPVLRVYEALSSHTTELVDLGTDSAGGDIFHCVRLRPLLPSASHVDKKLSDLASQDLCFDPNTSLLAIVRDKTHPLNNLDVDIPRSTEFSDYRAQNGLLIPFKVSQTLHGQLLWSAQFTQVRINPGLSDADLQF